MNTKLPFLDRREAGKQLGAAVAGVFPGGESLLVLALPRGGLPVAAEVALILRSPLDVLGVRKLGVPWQPELAMGAITSSARVLDKELIRQFGISQSDLHRSMEREAMELSRREKLYRSGLPALDIRGRTVLLVDDGLATGMTMLAAVRHARAHESKAIVVAVPVASEESLDLIRREADECICLATPSPFRAVGEWYIDFRSVTDGEVVEALARFHARPLAAGTGTASKD